MEERWSLPGEIGERAFEFCPEVDAEGEVAPDTEGAGLDSSAMVWIAEGSVMMFSADCRLMYQRSEGALVSGSSPALVDFRLTGRSQ